MNFKEWYNTKGAGSHPGHTEEKEWGSKDAWDACKNEILKTIESSKIDCITEEIGGKFIDYLNKDEIIEIIEKIENL